MKLKVFTLQFSGSTAGFDDKPLQDFIADKEVIEFSEHFFIHENTPCLTILIAYRSLESLESRRVVRQADPRLEFDGVEKEAYDALRAWRAAAAKVEGIPPYMIANNRQLAKMIISLKSTCGSRAMCATWTIWYCSPARKTRCGRPWRIWKHTWKIISA